jgi:hypothetical protein
VWQGTNNKRKGVTKMDKHKAIVFGEVRRVAYYIYSDGEISETTELVEYETIFEGYIDNPPLEYASSIFIGDINESVRISKIARNIEGGYVYYSDHVVKVIKDDETLKSKKDAEEKSKIKIEKRRIEAEQEKEKDKKWYQMLFK